MLFCTYTQIADVEIISQDDELTGIETFEKNKTLTQTVIKVIFSGGWLAALSKGHTEETAIQGAVSYDSFIQCGNCWTFCLFW